MKGMTEYLGVVLTSRSGLWSPELTRDILARYAANYDLGRAGRQWRNLQDTTQQPIVNYRGRQSYDSWQRGKDYYTEGIFVWLDVDTKIRELTRGKRSLDDFARAFYGVEDGRIEPLTYTFEDVVATLNAVTPYDWASMLRARLDGHGPGAPLDGLARGGWRVAFKDEPSPSVKETDSADGTQSFLYSLGVILGKDGKVGEVYLGQRGVQGRRGARHDHRRRQWQGVHARPPAGCAEGGQGRPASCRRNCSFAAPIRSAPSTSTTTAACATHTSSGSRRRPTCFRPSCNLGSPCQR